MAANKPAPRVQKKTAKAPAPKATPTPKPEAKPAAGNTAQAILSFTYVTPEGQRGSCAKIVSAGITKAEETAIMARKSGGGEILAFDLKPFSPGE